MTGGVLDDHAFTRCVDEHWPGLVRRLTLVLHDTEEAEDVAQETMFRAHRAWERFDGRDERAWLYTIGLRLAFNRLRGRRRFDRWFRAQRPETTWVTPERIDVWRAIGELRAEHRAALLLNVLDGYTQAEISTMLGAPLGTVASWIASGKARVRRVLGEEMES